MKYLTATVALTALGLSHLSVAHSETNTQQRSETVKFSDLDISSPGGARLLFQRLTAAAARVCRDPGESHLPDLQLQAAQCRNQALGDAVATLDAPAVMRIAEEHGLHPSKAAGSN